MLKYPTMIADFSPQFYINIFFNKLWSSYYCYTSVFQHINSLSTTKYAIFISDKTPVSWILLRLISSDELSCAAYCLHRILFSILFTFSLSLYFNLTLVVDTAVRPYFLIQSDNLCLLSELFRPLMTKRNVLKVM